MVRLSSAASITRYKVSGMDWNDCPESNGIGVRNRPERVSGMPRNTQVATYVPFGASDDSVNPLTVHDRSCPTGN
jgi:hypothetical protein